jgi:hypothetical protein
MGEKLSNIGQGTAILLMGDAIARIAGKH